MSIGGFDLHDNLIANHPALLGKVSDAMTAFYNATVELGVASKVTAFTASDFGRTLTSNGDGSDHGWGSHHFMVGGAVKGKAFYGNVPPVSVGSTLAASDQQHVGQGRLLPTTSVDQYASDAGQMVRRGRQRNGRHFAQSKPLRHGCRAGGLPDEYGVHGVNQAVPALKGACSSRFFDQKSFWSWHLLP